VRDREAIGRQSGCRKLASKKVLPRNYAFVHGICRDKPRVSLMRLKNFWLRLGRLNPRKRRPGNRNMPNAQVPTFDRWSMSDMAMFQQSSLQAQQQHILRLMDRTFIDRQASESDHRRAKEIAKAVLDGRTTVLEAARELVSVAHTDAIAELEDRRFIIGVASETDHLPVGEVRKLWAPSALEEKDIEIARAEELYKADFLETCRRIVNPNSRGR